MDQNTTGSEWGPSGRVLTPLTGGRYAVGYAHTGGWSAPTLRWSGSRRVVDQEGCIWQEDVSGAETSDPPEVHLLSYDGVKPATDPYRVEFMNTGKDLERILHEHRLD